MSENTEVPSPETTQKPRPAVEVNLTRVSKRRAARVVFVQDITDGKHWACEYWKLSRRNEKGEQRAVKRESVTWWNTEAEANIALDMKIQQANDRLNKLID